MSNLGIEVRGLTKHYHRGIFSAGSLRDAVMSKRRNVPVPNEFRALSDVSFEVERGTVCGVIGANGSGKTTLLKILASITEPSSGEARIFGKVGSLLDAGAGFDPELTGLDNIYLSGAIVGLSRAQVRSKLDSIIDFADIGPVLQTQVKRYSSGMYARLAFAVAVHVEADILLLDEILAVSDIAFRTKCLIAIRELAQQGRTILFVSHNAALVQQACDQAILLRRGQLIAADTPEIIGRHYAELMGESHVDP